MPNPFLDISLLGESIPTRDKREVRFNCPYCDDDKYHCYVNLEKSVYHCFKCGISGKTNAKLREIQALQLYEVDRQRYKPPRDPIRLPPACPELITLRGIKYLTSRGLYDGDVGRHKIYCASPSSKYFGRLILPYNARSGYASYFVARAYTSLAYPKYLNPPGGKDIVFFSPQEPDPAYEQYWGLNELVLVEGPFDMIKMGRHGPAGAMLGKELKHSQARIIVSSFEKVYILLDNDTTGELSALKVRDLLQAHCDVKILQRPMTDPGDMTPESIKELMAR